MTSQTKKSRYLDIYKLAHNNAVGLIDAARTLLVQKKYGPCYALAFTALEEISKSQFAADVFTGFSKEQEFLKSYRDHNKKIKRVSWAHHYANSYPHNQIWLGSSNGDTEQIAPAEPLFEKRNNALYVWFDNDNIYTPAECISEQDAKEIIHIAEIAFQRILETTEYWGHQIGTKGFMK